jgi:hypothetical protein
MNFPVWFAGKSATRLTPQDISANLFAFFYYKLAEVPILRPGVCYDTILRRNSLFTRFVAVLMKFIKDGR